MVKGANSLSYFREVYVPLAVVVINEISYGGFHHAVSTFDQINLRIVYIALYHSLGRNNATLNLEIAYFRIVYHYLPVLSAERQTKERSRFQYTK